VAPVAPSSVAAAPPGPPAEPASMPSKAVGSMWGSSTESDGALEAPVQARSPGAAKPAAASDAPGAEAPAILHHDAMLIYAATLVIAVYQVEASLGKIEEIARGSGGYLANRTDAAITVRIPRARFQEVLGKIEKLGDVLHRTVTADDVTDQVVDLEARLKNARAMRERLAELLHGATATKDALEIEKELSRVMGDIESMEGKLKLFSDKIAYSTVTATFEPVHDSEVHAIARLPLPWLQELGLSSLLRVQ
jgi:Domain of unknown function (DUF4349)